MTPTEVKEKVLAGGNLAIERLIERKCRDNSFIVISVDGKVTKVDAKTLKK